MKLPQWINRLIEVRQPREPEIKMSMRVYREKTGQWEDGPPVVVSKRAPLEVIVRSLSQ